VVPLELSFVLAALCHHLVEEPVRRSQWLSRRTLTRAYRRASHRRAAVALAAADGAGGRRVRPAGTGAAGEEPPRSRGSGTGSAPVRATWRP
jgi:hypothetical protein